MRLPVRLDGAAPSSIELNDFSNTPNIMINFIEFSFSILYECDSKISSHFPMIRFNDVPVLHKNRADNVCQIERNDHSYESVFSDKALEIGFSGIRRIWNAWHIFQLWTIQPNGQIHRTRGVSSMHFSAPKNVRVNKSICFPIIFQFIGSFRDHCVRYCRWFILRGRHYRFHSEQFIACDSKENRTRQIQLIPFLYNYTTSPCLDAIKKNINAPIHLQNQCDAWRFIAWISF